MADAEVRLGADSSAVKTGMNSAADNVAAATQRMREQMARMAEVSAAASAKFDATQKKIGTSAQDASDQVVRANKKTVDSMDALSKRMIHVGATAVGGFIGREAIRNVIAFEDGVEKLQRTFGVSADKAVNMSIALKLAGSSADSFNTLALNVGRVLRTQADEFTRLGVNVRDATGNFLPMETVLANVYKRMQDFKVGTDQNEVALALTGRSAKEFGDTMENLERVQTRATELQKQFGIEMGEGKQADIKAYKTEVAALGIAMDAMSLSLGQKAMPMLQTLAGFFSDIGPGAIKVMEIAVNSIITAFYLMGAAAATAAILITGAFTNISEGISLIGKAFAATIRGEWGSIPGIIMNGNQRIKANTIATADSVAATWKNSYDKIKSTWATPPVGAGAAGGPPKGGSLSFTPKPKGGGGGEDSRMSGWENELKAQRDAFERMKLEQGSFEKWSEDQTSAYWKRILDTQNVTEKERIAVSSKYYDAERVVRQQAFEASIAQLESEKQAIKFNYDERVRLAQEAARRIAAAYGAGSREAIAAEARVTQEIERGMEQRTRLAEVAAKQDMQRAEHGATMEKMAIDQKVALGQASVQQAIQAEMSLQDRLYQIKLAAYQRELALERDPVRIAAINSQIEGLEQTHQERMTQLQNDAIRERAQAAIDATNAVTSGMANALGKLATDAKNWKQILLDGIKQLEGQLAQLAAKQVIKNLFGPGTAGGKGIGDFFGKMFGSGGGADPAAASQAEATASAQLTTAKTAETTTTTFLTTIMETLTAAATSAAAALQSVAASSASSGAASGLGSLFGGAGGGGSAIGAGGGFGEGTALAGYAAGTPYVPQDMVAQIHKGEAVIPASMNKGGALGGTTIHAPVTLQVNGPIDSRSRGQIAAGISDGIDMAKSRYR